MAGIEMEKLMELNTLVFSSLEFLFRYLPLFLLLFFVDNTYNISLARYQPLL